MNSCTPRVAPYFFRDLADGLQQQMFFWGQDVLHPEGNFLMMQGFERSPSKGIKGTSCYRLPWQHGHIELYGSCAGWYAEDGGFAFIRPQKRCTVWTSSDTPIPGAYQTEFMRPITISDLYAASIPFLDWLITYEETVIEHFGHAYRDENFDRFRKLPKSKTWLQPMDALNWIRCFRNTPSDLKRPRHFGAALAERLKPLN